jgi:hypothetical protein
MYFRFDCQVAALPALACAASCRLAPCWAARCAYVGAAVRAYGCILCKVVLATPGHPLTLRASLLGAAVLAAVLAATLEAARRRPARPPRASSPTRLTLAPSD